MVEHERLIISPVPDWNFCVPVELKERGFCLSYQYDFDEKSYGPYGFITNNALIFISALFPTLFYYDDTRNEIIKKDGLGKQGVYFYNDDAHKYSDILNELNVGVRINEMRKKNGLAPKILNEEPFFSRVMNGKEYDTDKILNLVNEKVDFFIFKSFSPVLGGAIVFFSNEIIQRILTLANKDNLPLIYVDSLEQLEDW